MSVALKNFNLAISDAQELLDCYDSLNKCEEKIPPEVLKRATLIMVLTAWETYVEDIATELFEKKFGALKGCHIGTFMEDQFITRLKMFHNPDSQKTKKLFEEFFGIDVTEKWVWSSYKHSDQVRQNLNRWLKRRGEAVHRAQVDITKPDIVKRDELDKCIRFFSELVLSTDKILESV